MGFLKCPIHSHYLTMRAMMLINQQSLVVGMRLIGVRVSVAEGLRISARHQAAMLRSLKEVQADDSVIGFYQATTLGAFFNQTLVNTQAIHQDKLRHGGIVIVHGEHVFWGI